jgi:hypothetical protein
MIELARTGEVLAHQGGWDEMLYVLVPISLFAWLLSLANKRATREQAARHQDDGDDDITDDEPD